MIEHVAVGLRELPIGSLRVVSYESGRMTLEFAASDEAAVRRLVARLLQTGLSVDAPTASKRAGSATVVLTVRSS
jgi:general secretion pathway protein L